MIQQTLWAKPGLHSGVGIFPRDTGTASESPASFVSGTLVTVIRYLLPSSVDVRVDANVLSLPLSSF